MRACGTTVVRKVMALVIATFMALVVATPAFAAAPDSGTITVNNAAKGEGYAVYKILDATINNSGGINYTGTIPTELESVLEVTEAGTAPNTYSAITKKSGVSDDDLFAALKDYVAQTVEGKADWDTLVEGKTFDKATDSTTATGNSVTFNVDPGYYVVVSTQGTAVMINSATDPAAEINEKNTATFKTANYVDGQPVTKYTISDTLPPFLSGATIKSVTVAGTAISPTPSFDANKQFEIAWATKSGDEWTSTYNNGAEIKVVYEATLTSTANIGSANTNTISIKPTLGDDDEPTEKNWDYDDEIKTYAAALKKTDGTNALAGAEFQVKGLIATEKEAGSGIWIVSSYDPTSTATPTTLTTDSSGKLYIVGLAEGASLSATETKAPNGFNKITGTFTLTPQLMETTSSKTTTWEKYDSKGNLIDSKTTETAEYTQVTKSLADLDADAVEVINHKGTELPETGGMGTRILYTIGGIMVVGGAIVLISKRRLASMEK